MNVQDDLIVLLWQQEPNSFTTEIMQRLPDEQNMPFVQRIIARIKAISASFDGAPVVVYTGEAAGSVSIADVNVVDLDPSFIDELLGG